MTFGQELRRLRQAAGLSLSELAARIHYSKGYLSKVENGMVPPNDALAALCDTEFGTQLSALLPADRRATDRLSTLPAVTTNFTGRTTELAELRAALLDREVLGSAAVCVIDGMAGAGKTTLALRCAHRLEAHFPDGTLFLDLRGHEVTAGSALDRLLRLLGVPGDEIPPDVDDRAARYRDRLTGRAVLVVLDNARSAEQVRPLIPAEPRCRVLITSRQRLVSLDDAHRLTLGPLTPLAAAALFSALADTSPGDAAVVESIVDRCGRLPLAIRIAAARLRSQPSWQPADLDRRLRDERALLSELDDGERGIAAAFQLSYQDQPEPRQRLFALLSVHPGADLELYSAAALAGADLASTERLLAGLHDARLINQLPTGRYQLHDLLRAFARDKLPPAARRPTLLRLLELNCHAADQAARFLTPQRYRRDVERPSVDVPALTDDTWLRDEWQNLVALCRLAHDEGQHERSWQLALALRDFFFHNKLWDPWLTTSSTGLAAARAAGDTWVEANCHNDLGIAHLDQGDVDRAAEHYGAALALFRARADEHGIHTTLGHLAWANHYRGNHTEARDGFRAVLDFLRRTDGSPRTIAITLRGLALVTTSLGEHELALSYATEALAGFTELDLGLDVAMTYNCIGWIHYQAGDHEAAVAAYREALEHSERCGSNYEAARAETGLGNVAAATGDDRQAQRHWTSARERHPNLNPLIVPEAAWQASES